MRVHLHHSFPHSTWEGRVDRRCYSTGGTFEAVNAAEDPNPPAATGNAPSAWSAQATLTEMKIHEGIADYAEYITQTEQAKSEQLSARAGNLDRTRAEGAAALKELGAQAAYETKAGYQKATMVSLAQEAKIGASGVRAAGSPLLAAQQASDTAWGEAGETARRGASAVTLGGLKLGGTLADYKAETSLLTGEYQRKLSSATRKKTELEANEAGMISAANWGAVIDWTKFAIGTAFTIAG
jgi:hypothetical protein